MLEAKDSVDIRDADESKIFLRPVLKNLFPFAAACHRKIHATRLAVDMAKLQTGFADGRVVYDRKEAYRIRHDSSVEKRLVMIEKIREVNVAIKVCALMAELHHHAA